MAAHSATVVFYARRSAAQLIRRGRSVTHCQPRRLSRLKTATDAVAADRLEPSGRDLCEQLGHGLAPTDRPTGAVFMYAAIF